ncbi:MAG: hypothetical protein ACXWWC_02805 [Chitinophagaceae bacterium]
MEKRPICSLAQLTFNRDLFDGKMTTLNFIREAGEIEYEVVEYVSHFFQNKVKETVFIDSLNKQAKESGVENLLIMVDDA